MGPRKGPKRSRARDPSTGDRPATGRGGTKFPHQNPSAGAARGGGGAGKSSASHKMIDDALPKCPICVDEKGHSKAPGLHTKKYKADSYVSIITEEYPSVAVRGAGDYVCVGHYDKLTRMKPHVTILATAHSFLFRILLRECSRNFQYSFPAACFFCVCQGSQPAATQQPAATHRNS